MQRLYAEQLTVRGKATHGAIDPWNGVNALSVTTSAIQMMGLMRETFREEDHVRLHNVIRKAGDVINSVPDEAVIETKVRAASLEQIEQIIEMVNRWLRRCSLCFWRDRKGRYSKAICRFFLVSQIRH